MKNKRTFFWILSIAALLLINFLASVFHARFDLTEDKRYSLTPATKKLVGEIEQPVTIDVFLSGEFPAGFRKLSATTKEFLQTLKEYNNQKITYNFIDPEENISEGKTYGDSLTALGVSPINLTVQVKSGQQNKLVYPVAILRTNDNAKIIDLYSGGKRFISANELNAAESMMEYRFAKALDELNRKSVPLIAYSTGNGEPTGPETYSLQQLLQNDYRLFTLNINSQPFIPDTIKALMIVKPSQPFSQTEKEKIDQYVMRGGKLFLFIDGLFAEQDSLRFKPQTLAFDRNLALDDLLFRYGARINPDLIMDLQSDFMPFAVGGSEGNPQYEFLHWNYYPLFEGKSNHSITKNLGLISGKFVNSIDTVGDESIRKTVLLSSSSNSRLLKTPVMISLNENRNTPEDAAFRMKDIPAAVLLEGKFTSLYKGRMSKANRDSLDAYGLPFREQSPDNKIIVASDGDMVLNDVSGQQGPLPMGMNLYTSGTQYEYAFSNAQFVLNCLEYLTGKPDIMQTRNKEIVLRLLDSKKVSEEKTKWQFVNIVLPVVLVILFGILYQQLRKRKYAGA